MITGLPNCSPVEKTDGVITEVLGRVAEGEQLSHICRSGDRLPTPQLWHSWCRADAELAAQFSDALAAGADWLADDVLLIADDSSEPVDHRKLRIEARWKLLKHRAPDRYGDKQKIEHEGGLVVNILDPTRKPA